MVNITAAVNAVRAALRIAEKRARYINCTAQKHISPAALRLKMTIKKSDMTVKNIPSRKNRTSRLSLPGRFIIDIRKQQNIKANSRLLKISPDCRNLKRSHKGAYHLISPAFKAARA
jgi:hypothetical protein